MNQQRRMARLGVLFDKDAAERRWRAGVNVFERYVEELLEQEGLPFHWFEHPKEIAASDCDLWLIALEPAAPLEEWLLPFLRQGGAALSFGGLNRLAASGEAYAVRAAGSGTMEWTRGDGVMRRLKALEATPWIAREGGTVSAADSFPAAPLKFVSGGTLQETNGVHRVRVGAGVAERWAVDLCPTVVGIQQGGGPVTEDGLPAPDGTADLDDGILKADDRCGLDWREDREATESGCLYFSRPYADWWRELLTERLIRISLERGLTLPFVGKWPEGIPAVALISHDSDMNSVAAAETTLTVTKHAGIRTTWCMIEPGYPREWYDRIAHAGHEIAFHYNAVHLEGKSWDEADFARQLEHLKQSSGAKDIVSNKNHYTRFEGWGDLFAWCERYGIASDQTRGPSKRGNVGFLFGTCQPYFPIAGHDLRNRRYDVLEVGFATQDLDIGTWADRSVIRPFLSTALDTEGAAHFLFHQHWLHEKPAAREALLATVREARSMGIPFWTNRDVNEWMRARRKARIEGIGMDGVPRVGSASTDYRFVVWVPLEIGAAADAGADAEAEAAVSVKYGLACRKYVIGEERL